MDDETLLSRAVAAADTIVRLVFRRGAHDPAVLVVDEDSPLSRLLARAYRQLLPDATTYRYGFDSPERIQSAFNAESRGAFAILVESTRFELSRHRFRVDLFRRGWMVAEHPHLSSIREDEMETYLESLHYDAGYYRTLGPALKGRIDSASQIVLAGDGFELSYDTPFEDAKLNIGDYSASQFIGGQFPIGEVFTEPRDLTRVSGSIRLFAFGGRDFTVLVPEKPIELRVEAGIVVDAPNAPPPFQSILEEIRAAEQVVWLRELGFGLNRALTRSRRVSDVGAYERMCGIHISLGAKHAVYPKPGFSKRKTKFHVDVFPEIERAEIDGRVVFESGRYLSIEKETALAPGGVR